MPNLNLPTPMATLRPALPDLVSYGQKKAPYFAVFLSSKQGLRIAKDNREEQITEQPTPSAGTVLTAFDGVTNYERAVGGFALQDLNKAARELTDGVTFNNQYKSTGQAYRRSDFVTPMKTDPQQLSTQEKLDTCRDLHLRLQGLDPRIVNVRVMYVEANEFSVFVNPWSDLAQRVQRVRLFVYLFASGSDGQIRFNWESKGATGGWEMLEFSDEDIQILLKNTLGLLGAERIEPGEYQVITAPGVSGTIAHESFGHGVETDMFLKERAKAAHFIDKQVGSSLVSIEDDPSLHEGFGSYFFDDEGQVAAPTKIVENGIFRRGITDLYSASALGLTRSANGRRQDYTRKAYARMSNTFFSGGTSTLDDLLAQVDHGIYLDQWYSGMEDPQGWGIQVSCHFGHEIKAGKITDRVFAPIGVSGYVPEVLGSISAVSQKVAMDPGGCGKGHKEYVPVASGGPHLLLKAPLA